MKKHISHPLYFSFAGTIALIAYAPAQAQVSLNYDDLSYFEEPLAFEVGAATVLVNGAVDVPATLAIDNKAFADDFNVDVIGSFQVNGEMQLSNRWTIGATYFGQYSENADDYADNVAGYVRTSWGSFIGGNVNGLVRDSTRRRRGAGNGVLAFDGFYGRINDWGGGYSGRYGPTVLSAVADKDGNFEVGAVFQRPIGNKDNRIATRVARAKYLSADGTRNFETAGIGAVGELVFGSSLYDLGVGYERLQAAGMELDRWYVSSGMQTKIGSLSLSASGHYGELDGTPEKSASLGLGYDIARGFSANLGINARRADVSRDGVQIIDQDETNATASVRYSF